MTYKNPHFKKVKNTRPLLVSCLTCKAPLCTYQKGGRGNLIKLQVPRIIESNVSLNELKKGLFCPQCQTHLGSLRDYKGRPTYYLLRSMTTSQELEHYKY